MYKTYLIGFIMVLFGISGLLIDLIEGRAPSWETYSYYILTGLGMMGLRIAIKTESSK